MMQTIAPEIEILQILRGEHQDAFHVLGAHLVEVGGKPAVAIRVFLPNAAAASVVAADLDRPEPMTNIDSTGFFEAVFCGRNQIFPYRLLLSNSEGHTWEIFGPYSFWPVLTDFDVHLFNEGSLLKAYEKLGAHLWCIGDVAGVFFAVWAPNASRVSVVGDFNSWDGRRHPMRSRGFEWIDFADHDHSVISFMRKAKETHDAMVVAGNFTPVPRTGYRIGVPRGGAYRIIFNSDAEAYGGANMGNGQLITADPIPYQGLPYSLSLILPPLAVVYFLPEAKS